MKIVSSIVLTLSVSWSMANAAASADPAGIRVVGQKVDGTLILDDSVSGLSTWAAPGLAMPAGETVDAAPTLLVIGHVENWDPKTGVLTVSGQTTTLAEGATIMDAPRNIKAMLTADNLSWYLQKGRYIAVAGDTYGGGESLATHIVRLDNEAKPGTVPIYVRGSLDLVDDVQGIAYIGSMALDLNSIAAGEYPATGNVVEVLAYQANAGSAIVSEYSSLESAGMRGAGSKVAGITGSGARAQGINGSGARSQGITGSGARAQGITGSGARAQGITGSGARAQGITGSGARAQGITGSGARAQGINGSGARAQGITGSGARS